MQRSTLHLSLLTAFAVACCGTAHAAGLGRINVLSALGQPLSAEVEIAATPEELDSMSARLAPVEAFRQANIEYTSALTGVRMAVERRPSGAAVVRISSDKPVNDPFVDLLVELNWAGGRLLREYTFLLDPVDLGVNKPAPVVNAPVARPSERPVPGRSAVASSPPTRSSVPAPTPAQATDRAPSTALEDGRYTVQSGDTLSGIAGELRPESASVDQMLAALYQNNKAAFVGGNINRLRSGQILKVPDADAVKAIAPREARRIVLQASSFDAYSNKLAGAVAEGEARGSGETQRAAGKIAPLVKEQAPATTSGDQLKISKGSVAKDAIGGGDKAAAGRVQALEEDLVARDKALQEANSRVVDLERNIRELQKLIELKNQDLAALQKQAQSKAPVAAPAQPEAPVPPPAPTAAAEAQPVSPAESTVSPEAQRPVEPVPAAQTPPEAESPQPAPPPKPPVRKPVAKPQPAPVVEEPGFFALLLENPLTLAGLGSIAVLGLGYAAYKARLRRRDRAELPPTTTSLGEASGSNSVFGSAGGQTVDTGTSMMQTDFSQSGLSAIDADEGVDPVAEADVYMAYGRDAQAEEILLDALKTDPGRAAIYLKLLEIYAQRKNPKQFETVATDLYTQTGGVGADWEKAAALGAKLDPENPLYKGHLAAVPSGSKEVEAAPVAAMAAVTAAPVVAMASEPEVPVSSEAPEADDALSLDLELPEADVEAESVAQSAVSFGTGSSSEMKATWTMPGEMGQIARGVEGADAAKTQIVTPQIEAAPADPMSLDFNLDLELPVTDTSAPVEVPAADATMLEFDIAEPEPVAVAEAKLSQTQPGGLSFDLELDQAAPAVETAATPPMPIPAPSEEQAMRAMTSTDIDLGLEVAPGRDKVAVVDLEQTNFESSLLDFDFDLKEGGDSEVGRTVDLSGIDLGSEGQGRESAAAAVLEAAAVEIDVNEEVGTKLELAKAYEDMGDQEGARELLEEVMRDGSNVQQEEARGILARIS